MKKIFATVIFLILILSLSLPCFANFPPSDFRANDYEEYKEKLKEKELAENYLPYERVRFLGEFDRYNHVGPDSCTYYLKAPNGSELSVRFNDYFVGITAGYLRVAAWQPELMNKDSLLSINVDAILARTGYDIKDVEYFYFAAHGCTYYYTKQGRLSSIGWQWGDDKYEIFAAFSKYDCDSLLGRTVVENTATDAISELKLRLAGLYREPWEQPLTICLSAIGGAAVAAVTAWAITYCVMRKKAKNASRLATNGENAALEAEATPDGAPDSTPTPPEETPPNTPDRQR